MRSLALLRQAWGIFPPLMSLALARKYRPRNFAGVAVQSHVSDTLRGAIARGA